MTSGAPEPEFGLETLELDLPPLAAAIGQRLREAGLAITPDRSAEFARALSLVAPQSRRRLYWTARSVFVTDRAQLGAFDRVFGAIFGRGEVPDRAGPEDAAVEPTPPDERPRADRNQPPPGDRSAADRPPSIAAAPAPVSGRDEEQGETGIPRAIASEEERLAGRSFDGLEPDELARLYRLMSQLELATPSRRSRRYEKAGHGRAIDLRRTLRTSLRSGGDPVHLARRRRRVVRRRLVMLCDISGSMEPYARAYLQFLTCAARSGPDAEAFVFATRLTRLTRALSSRNPERAIQRAAAAAPDWSSGTRIGEALREFNDRHGRRGMARGAVIVILSDGWERGEPMLVGREMERLARLAHRVVWVNPRLSGRDFSVRVGGMRAALAHCDALVSGHSFAALSEVIEAIGAPSAAAWAPPLSAAPDQAEDTAAEDEPWASATPVPGSSVAMPSGYGPSRGKTTPGWGGGEDG